MNWSLRQPLEKPSLFGSFSAVSGEYLTPGLEVMSF